MFGNMSDPVRFSQADVRVDIEFGIRVEAMPDPSQPHAAHRAHPRLSHQRRFRGIHQCGIHPVHQPPEYISNRGAQHHENRHGDHQSNDRVRQGISQCDTSGTQYHSQ
ncbi:Uncharacterised protein [Mycobacteroides abscessus subsp. massiliense]|nr:Uncharacterised protein [Mycobacteroides abscessus subsp. massiliense]